MTFVYTTYTYVMDVLFLYQDQRFVWDAEKASSNLAKHGIAFEQARQVFSDPFAHFEDASAHEESRDAAIGVTEDITLLFHIYRDDSFIRIISARPVTPYERNFHENSL